MKCTILAKIKTTNIIHHGLKNVLFRGPGQVNFSNGQVTFQAHSAWKVIHQVIHLKTQLLGHRQTSLKRPPKRSSLSGHLQEDWSITRAYTILGQNFASLAPLTGFSQGNPVFPSLQKPTFLNSSSGLSSRTLT